VGSRPVSGLVLHRLPHPQGAEPDDGTWSQSAPQRPLQGPGPQSATGPNQRWCWDISYLLTGQKGEYLYLLLDEWSRKASGPTSSSIDAVRNLPSAAGAGKKTKSRKPAHENKQNNNNARRPCSVITPRFRSLIQKRAVPQKQLNGLVVSKATPPGNITRE
jgi:hypothetical protein